VSTACVIMDIDMLSIMFKRFWHDINIRMSVSFVH